MVAPSQLRLNIKLSKLFFVYRLMLEIKYFKIWKASDGEIPVLRIVVYLFIAITPRSTLT